MTQTSGWSKPSTRVGRAGLMRDPVAHRHRRAAARRAARRARSASSGSGRLAQHRVSRQGLPALGRERAAPRRRTPRRGARSCGTCRGWRRPGTAAPHRPAAPRSKHQRVAASSAVVALQRHAGGSPAPPRSPRASRPISATARAWRATGAASGAKSWPLPSPPRMTTSLRRRLVGAQAVQRGDGRADVGALAVVEGLDAVDAGDGLDAVRLAAVFAQAVQHRRQRAADGGGQRQRGQRVGRVVAAADAQRVGRHQALQVDLVRRRPCARFVRFVASSARTSQAMPFSTTRPKSPGRCGASSAEA